LRDKKKRQLRFSKFFRGFLDFQSFELGTLFARLISKVNRFKIFEFIKMKIMIIDRRILYNKNDDIEKFVKEKQQIFKK